MIIWLVNSWNFQVARELLTSQREYYLTQGVPAYNARKKTYEATIMAEKYIRKKYGLNNIIQYEEEALMKLNTENNLAIISFKSLEPQYKKILTNYTRPNKNILFSPLIPNLSNKELLDDGHPSSKGHDLITSEILDYVLNNYLVNCRKKID